MESTKSTGHLPISDFHISTAKIRKRHCCSTTWQAVVAAADTLDDPCAEVTAPAEAGNIVKGDQVSLQPTDLRDVFVI